MSDPHGPLAVLGIGNVLLGDDGAGVRAVAELEGLADRGTVFLPEGTALHDGGTLGLDLLAIVAEARAVLFVDAADLGLAPGTVAIIAGDALRAHVLRGAGGTSGLRAGGGSGVAEIILAGHVSAVLPEAVALVAIQAADTRTGLALSSAVEAALPAAIESVVTEAWRLADEASAAAVRLRARRAGAGAAA